MVSWCVIDSNVDMKAIAYKWDFRISLFPDYLRNKSKAYFCAHGGKKWEDVNCFKLMNRLCKVIPFIEC